jgi:hypothetical protein
MKMEPQAGVPITMLIDGSHVDRLKSKLGQAIDLDRLVVHFKGQGRPVRPVYYRDSRDVAEQARLERFSAGCIAMGSSGAAVTISMSSGMSVSATAATSLPWLRMQLPQLPMAMISFFWPEMPS